MLNKVILIGHVGQDPEIRAANGKEFAVFSLATSERWKDKDTGERKEKTEWHRIVTFSEPLVKTIKSYIKKGSKLYIEGTLTTRKWDDNGVDKYATEVLLKPFQGVLTMLDSAGGRNEPPDSSYENQ